MDSNIFNSMEIDAIGEILNISLGASATAVSTMLGKRVDITTPNVEVISFDEFEYSDLEPAIGIEITYISGLSGSNIMILKRQDVKMIVELLMGYEIPEEEFEFNEINMSAICEVMNQMMGASSTALSEFLGEVVNISTPVSFEVKDEESFKKKCFNNEKEMVVVNFKLKIEDLVESRFMNLMPLNLAKKLISVFGLGFGIEGLGELYQEEPEVVKEEPKETPASSGKVLSQEEIEKLLSGGGLAQEEKPEAKQENIVKNETKDIGINTGEEMQRNMGAENLQMQNAYNQAPAQAAYNQAATQAAYSQAPAQAAYNQTPAPATYNQGQAPYFGYEQNANMTPVYVQPQPKMINAQPLSPKQFDIAETIGEEQAENLALIMDVPLEISVEIGRTRKVVKDILEFTSGSLIVLDKLAGDQVDIYANGQCIAKGDVVVVDDSFGVRITEIIKQDEILKK